MHWHFEVRTKEGLPDPLARNVERDLPWLGMAAAGPVETSRLFLLSGDIDRKAAKRLAADLLTDPVVQEVEVKDLDKVKPKDRRAVTVCRKPGVTDPVEESLRRGAGRIGAVLDEVRTGYCFRFAGTIDTRSLKAIGERLLANAVVDDIQVGHAGLTSPRHPTEAAFERIDVALPDDDQALLALSKARGLSLDVNEMVAIRDHFRGLGRSPSDVELETLAQTWSEHCKHKTFSAIVEMDGREIDNLLKSTIFKATKDLARDFCVSVFKDNAGIIRFDERHDLCIKVETHNHPSAIEPYGGAGTGLGGVIRDILGTGLGGKPVANLDVFCVGEPDTRDLPAGVTHPLRVLKGVVAGVRDYGNRMGIPTVAGAVLFEPRYVGNPLVFCGTVGLIPHDRVEKQPRPGDKVVAIGGRTGRDGIHGATFSSRELHEESESLDGGAVQIGNAITEKRMMDVLLAARDQDLYTAVTDCGAGGFSSAVGEMGETLGARIDLDAAPLKYPGLTYREIWLSEAQERMVLAVPPDRLQRLLDLCASEDVEASVLGEFSGNGRLELFHRGRQVADLEMSFLHDGLPRPRRRAEWRPPEPESQEGFLPMPTVEALQAALADPNVASKEWIIRQYDHEVQSGSVVKPLVGCRLAGPSDGAVTAPVLGSTRGFALGLGINPAYADLDPHRASMAAIDEALRNAVAVGGDPDQTCILDNFSWGNTAKPDRLGALVRASEGCRDAALALRTPFVSGKDSLNNEYATADGTICIPHTLLVTALSIVPDVRRACTMDLKRRGSVIVLVGATRPEFGGSLWMRLQGRLGVEAPELDRGEALLVHRAMHRAIREGHVLSCHDLSEGGLGVALAEMAIAGGIGVDVDLASLHTAAAGMSADEILFSESTTRYLVEVEHAHRAAFDEIFRSLPHAAIGGTTSRPAVVVRSRTGKKVIDVEVENLRRIFESGLTRSLEGDSRG